MSNPFPVIETERLVLRELREGDAQAVFQIFGDDAVTRYYDLPTFTSVEQARLLISRMNARNASRDALRWGIALKENDAVIGTGGFNQFVRGWFRASIGYDLARAHWNKGYMTEALRAMENVTLLPHLGTAALEVREAMGLMALDNLLAFAEGRPLPNQVN